MAEYKDITKLKKEISDVKQELWESSCQNRSYITGYVSALSYVEGMIASLPAADVVEVVRCKDCLYNANGTCVHSESYDDTTHRPDYFCADGIRKEVQE